MFTKCNIFTQLKYKTRNICYASKNVDGWIYAEKNEPNIQLQKIQCVYCEHFHPKHAVCEKNYSQIVDNSIASTSTWTPTPTQASTTISYSSCKDSILDGSSLS